MAFMGTAGALVVGLEVREKLMRELFREPRSPQVAPMEGAAAGLEGKALVVGREGGPCDNRRGGGWWLMAGGGREDRLRPSRRSKEARPGPTGAAEPNAPKPGVTGAGAACIPENKSRLLDGVGAGAEVNPAKRSTSGVGPAEAALRRPPNKSMSLLAGARALLPPPENAERKSAKSSSAFTLEILLLSEASAS